MSMHQIPLTDSEREGLTIHKLPIGEPSQLSDAFRLGMQWVQRQQAQQQQAQNPQIPFTEGKVRCNIKEPSSALKPPPPPPTKAPANRIIHEGQYVDVKEPPCNEIREACEPLVDILNQLSNWLVCYPMMTKEDLIETAPTFIEDIDRVLKEHQKKYYGE